MKDLLFIHIPKTSGCSIKCLLENVHEKVYNNNIFINPNLIPSFILYLILVHPSFNTKYNCIKYINKLYYNKNNNLNIINNNNHTINHHNPILFYKKYMSNFEKYYTFSLVRHPYTRTLSLFKFTHPDNMINVKQFNIFLDNLLCGSLQKNTTFFHPQSYYLKNKKGKIIVDTILKYENSDKIKDFFIKNGYKWYMPSINKTKTKKCIQLNKNMKNKIYKIYQEDFKIFNYKQ